MLPTARPVPAPTPETQPFFDAAAAGTLQIQRCTDCERPFFYPRPCCPFCASGALEWITTSGRGTLYSYTITHRAAPGFEADVPYAIAVVQLAEGPRMMCNIVGVENTPDNLVLGMDLTVTFEKRGDVTIPQFAPAELGGQR
ncbi:Zn-ribbon domain-containing OB-fold protein [Streptomyces sp. NPDC051976]|uniref:Zn-ribbon domain-containing OB-fold protein n=1 Tax=Streptomyces sp. NPDC051976 TaxID=3154947 RepID=UPI0034319E36